MDEADASYVGVTHGLPVDTKAAIVPEKETAHLENTSDAENMTASVDQVVGKLSKTSLAGVKEEGLKKDGGKDEKGEKENGKKNEKGLITHEELGYTDNFYDEIDIADMDYDEDLETFFYPCPCGDRFQITNEQLLEGEDIARCPSCTLYIKVLYETEEVSEEEDLGER